MIHNQARKKMKKQLYLLNNGTIKTVFVNIQDSYKLTTVNNVEKIIIYTLDIFKIFFTTFVLYNKKLIFLKSKQSSINNQKKINKNIPNNNTDPLSINNKYNVNFSNIFTIRFQQNTRSSLLDKCLIFKIISKNLKENRKIILKFQLSHTHIIHKIIHQYQNWTIKKKNSTNSTILIINKKFEYIQNQLLMNLFSVRKMKYFYVQNKSQNYDII
ncbi:hypothetical protein [Blochmannia endosymbiont of Polyrhachis (Hedomyrma) turneri]|uniref:hypothetical protein n=1 Tax=Blochmannia endosymbiont of Polyrhachis (Hedomyrma) turneri TaxID=1505596 RepID=UPI000AA4937C|nr:hypothetical protein [Blochmannia endosymbiont of Polyrhachis (Hedomyrma) turneri]